MEEFKNIKIALLGSGTVGTGVYKLIERQKDELPHEALQELAFLQAF